MIQIHYTDKHGVTGVINYLSGDNVELSQPTKMFGKTVDLGILAKKELMKVKALAMAGKWSAVFPDDKFTVVEV